MGTLDSTKTRVIPVFDQISKKKGWLKTLITHATKENNKKPFYFNNVIITKKWGEEKSLHPHKSYLRWLVENIQHLNLDSNRLLKGLSSNAKKKEQSYYKEMLKL